MSVKVVLVAVALTVLGAICVWVALKLVAFWQGHTGRIEETMLPRPLPAAVAAALPPRWVPEGRGEPGVWSHRTGTEGERLISVRA